MYVVPALYLERPVVNFKEAFSGEMILIIIIDQYTTNKCQYCLFVERFLYHG